MTNNSYSYGKLCPQTHDAACQPTPSTTAKSTATELPQLLSAQEGRFWARVDKNGPINPRRPQLGPCWIWTGSRYTDKTGPTYGQTSYQGRRTTAHRASFLMHGGDIPDGLDVLHSCDVKPCVNPSHLRPGTHQENIREAFANLPPGHFAGENAGRARLTWPQIHAIRAAAASGASYVDLAPRYGVTATHISLIVRGLRWAEPKVAEAVA